MLGRIGRLDAEGLQTVVQRLARERSFLETLFNTIEDGVLVVDEHGRILYFNQAVTRLLGLQPGVEGQPITEFHARTGLGEDSPARRTRAGSASCGTNSRCTIRARAFSGSTPRRSMARRPAAPAWR